MRYTVRITTKHAGTFAIHVDASSPQAADNIAREAVRYQFDNDILSSVAVPTARRRRT